MIIQALKVVLEETELAVKVKEALSAVSQLKDVTFGLAPGVVKVDGKFQVGLSIPFETQWTVAVLQAENKLGVRLAHMSVSFFGMNAATMSTQVMAALAQKLQGVPGLAVESNTILIDLAVLLATRGIRLEAPVRRVAILQGRAEIDVG
jgi:hypothetical protein